MRTVRCHIAMLLFTIVDIESREYGIKGIYAHVSKIEMSIGDKEFVFVDGVGWEIVEDLDRENGSIVPDRVEIDFEQKIVTVYFT